ncbi:hypothetical protein OWV82_015221 [Melia azedarach]|uniref:Uncharacterized protein n=1 Tax=Melia azedarach TaxID=155640 RepID=A0ACC1XNP0_MELAZ|nr:hypothetical protein OWV82_015221 [Melia azedarach]
MPFMSVFAVCRTYPLHFWQKILGVIIACERHGSLCRWNDAAASFVSACIGIVAKNRIWLKDLGNNINRNAGSQMLQRLTRSVDRS